MRMGKKKRTQVVAGILLTAAVVSIIYVAGTYTGPILFTSVKDSQAQTNDVTEGIEAVNFNEIKNTPGAIGTVYEMRLGMMYDVYGSSGTCDYVYSGDGVLTLAHMVSGTAVDFQLKVGCKIVLGNSYEFEIVGWNADVLKMKLLDYQRHMQ